MNTDRAMELMSTYTYKPGYNVTAECYGSILYVDVEFEVENSSKGFSAWDDRPIVLAHQAFNIMVSEEMDDDTFKALVTLNMFLTVEAHECREFSRFDGVAQFHPHHDGYVVNGMTTDQAWNDILVKKLVNVTNRILG